MLPRIFNQLNRTSAAGLFITFINYKSKIFSCIISSVEKRTIFTFITRMLKQKLFKLKVRHVVIGCLPEQGSNHLFTDMSLVKIRLRINRIYKVAERLTV